MSSKAPTSGSLEGAWARTQRLKANSHCCWELTKKSWILMLLFCIFLRVAIDYRLSCSYTWMILDVENTTWGGVCQSERSPAGKNLSLGCASQFYLLAWFHLLLSPLVCWAMWQTLLHRTVLHIRFVQLPFWKILEPKANKSAGILFQNSGPMPPFAKLPRCIPSYPLSCYFPRWNPQSFVPLVGARCATHPAGPQGPVCHAPAKHLRAARGCCSRTTQRWKSKPSSGAKP